MGLDFINDLQTKEFTLKNDSLAKPQLGFIAQDVLSTLHHHNASHLSVVTQGDDGMYGMQYTQLIAPTIKAIQELDTKLTDNIEFLKLKIQYLEQEIKLLKGVA